jgi:hypothetical protein
MHEDPPSNSPTPDNPDQARADEDDDLRSSVTDLAGLLQGAGQKGLEDMLRHVAEFAVRAIPGADGAGLTLLEHDRADTMVASAEFVRQVDAIQYGLGEGPCISAAAQARTVHSGSLGTDRAWPRFGPRVVKLGVHSVLSLPLLARGTAFGAMNVYAHAENAFNQRSIHLGELYAVPAAISVQNAQALAQARRLSEQMQAAMTNRASIDQAIGIMMSRAGCTEIEAFNRLKTMSQAENRKMSAIAKRLVADAVRRARARNGDTRST